MVEKSFKEIIKPYLWEVDINNIDLKKHSFFIIERILDFGGNKEIDALFKKYDQKLIKKVIMESRSLGPRTVNFWCIKFNINRENTKCFMELSQKIWMPY